MTWKLSYMLHASTIAHFFDGTLHMIVFPSIPGFPFSSVSLFCLPALLLSSLARTTWWTDAGASGFSALAELVENDELEPLLKAAGARKK